MNYRQLLNQLETVELMMTNHLVMASSTENMEEDGRAVKKAKLMARPYQEELLKKALEKNSIVYLGTGAGKTFIASMIIKEKKGDILKRGKKTVFLVHRVPLVTQQAKFFEVQNPGKLVYVSFT